MIQSNMRYYANGRKKKYNAWSSKKKSHDIESGNTIPTYTYSRGNTSHIPSLMSSGHNCSKVETPEYTGTLIKGISTMHKSNAVPIINEEEAKEHARMRR